MELKKLSVILLLFSIIIVSGCVQTSTQPTCGNSIVESGEECDNSVCPAGTECRNCKCEITGPPPIPE